MIITKNTGRIVGLLFLLAAIAGGWGTSIRGLSGVKDETLAFLNRLVEHAGQMKLAISLDMLGSAIALGLAIFLYPVIQKYSQRLAIAYLGIGLINFAIITFSNAIHISLLSVGASYDVSTTSEAEHFLTLATMHYETYYWVHFLMLMLYSIGGAVLYYFLLKTRLIPKWLAFWGLLAQVLVFMGGALQMFDYKVSFYLFIQNGVFVLSFIVYLLVFGFKRDTYNLIKN